MARTEENSSVARNPNLLGDTWFFPGPVHVGDPPRLGEKIARPTKKDVPYFLNPFSLSTGGILLSYFDVGISMYLLLTPISYYMIATLDISATQYNAYTTLLSIPWSFKFAFGIITDCAPVNGYRRKNWLALGWLLFVGISLYMSTVDYPGFDLLTVSTFFMTCAYLLSDVCADSLAVERAKYEHLVIKGSLQTSNYTIRSFGNVLGAVLGAILYNTPIWGWGLDIAQLFLVSAIYPLMGVIPAIWTLEELAATVPAPAVVETIESMWYIVKRSAVWIPISYIYFYGVFQIPNAAWTNFLIIGLNFSDFEIGMISVAGCILFWLGMVAYKQFFFDTGWRWIYIYTTLVGGVFSLLQILLILRLNTKIGIPDFAFALGDSAIATFVAAIQFMPACIMFIMLCPDGHEGVTYALLTTISNLAGTVASDIGTSLTLIWDVNNTALEDGDFTGMLYLTILTSLLQIFPIFFVWVLPDSKAEQRKLVKEDKQNWWAGLALASVIVVSLLGSIAVNVYFIVEPGADDDMY